MKQYITGENEIDLFELLKSIFTFMFKNKWLLLLTLFLGAALGWFRVTQQPNIYTNYYQSTFYVKSSVITDEMLHTFIKNLNEQLPTVDNELTKVLKEVEPVKELSIDGLRSDIKIYVNYKEPVKNEAIINFLNDYLKGLSYYQLRVDSNIFYIKELQRIIKQKFDSLGIQLTNNDSKLHLNQLAKDNPTHFLAYVGLLEKYYDYEKQLVSYSNSLEFVPIEPTNNPISTTRKKMLTITGYGFLFLWSHYFSCMELLG
ncbi:MAG: hypothetical protein OQJ88_00260 [Flavobacteriales bacterium]|nr:hypothetical protein [Flavobacteriales bacterium]